MTTIIPWGITYYEEVRVNVTLPAYICPRERHVNVTSCTASKTIASTSERHSSTSRHVTASSPIICLRPRQRHVNVTSQRQREPQVHLRAIRQHHVTSASRHGVVANHLPSATSTSRQRQRPHRHDRHVAGPIRGPYSFNTAPMKTCNDHDLLETLSSSVPAGGLHVMPHHLCELGSMGLPSQMAFDSLSSLCI